MHEKQHAVLSASSSARWIACPPSAKLNAQAGSTSSSYARQGTDAHALCEYKVLKALGRSARDPTEDMEWFDEEMDLCSDQYCAFVLEQLQEAKHYCKDPRVLVEQRLDFSRWVPEGFGTGDCLIIADRLLQVIDFKYGVGVPVDADHNPQMMCYGLGALDTYDGIYDIREIRMTIFQPRLNNLSAFTMSKEDLLQWADETLRTAAELAIQGKGEFHAGDHCRFCAVKATCRKRAEYNLELARYDFRMPDELTPEEIAAILPRMKDLTSWASDVKDYALQSALSGTQYPGYKVVEGRSSRKYTDENAVAQAASGAGYDPWEKKLLGITAMTSLMGKKKFEEILGGLVTKPPGKPTLVPDTDKRPALNTAENDFKEEKGEN